MIRMYENALEEDLVLNYDERRQDSNVLTKGE